MGAWQSTPSNEVLQPSSQPPSSSTPQPSLLKDTGFRSRPPSSPPHPSRSELNPTRPRPRNALSYFISAPTSDLIHSHYNPNINDINKTIQILSQKLPPELVLRVIDESRYWAGCRNLLKKEIEVVSAQPGMRRLPRASGWKTGQEKGIGLRDEIGQIWYLLSGEVGCESSSSHVTGTVPARPEEGGMKPDVKDAKEKEGGEEEKDDGEEEEKGCWLREIVIETLSKDQGWSSAVTANPTLYGTYDQSYSWFEISILRNGTEVEGTRRSILNNVHAGQYYKAHRIVLGSEDDLVKQVKKGDRVILWVRAQYPGWRNLVREAAITLYCAPFPQV